MDTLNSYFSTLIFQYVETKQSHAMYIAIIKSRTDKQQCVIAFVPEHLAIQTKAHLSDLPWKNLQTRLCSQGTYKIQPQSWSPPNLAGLPEVMLNVTERKEGYSVYKATNFPFEVLMINSAKKKSIYQYPNTMNIYYAIDQFQTIFNYIGEAHPILYTQNPTIEFL